nr:MAG TPA: hypothetical protein [Caudoviricetes sp.]
METWSLTITYLSTPGGLAALGVVGGKTHYKTKG